MKYFFQNFLAQFKILPTFAAALNDKFKADVAQLVEQLICNQPVGGSSPFIGSRNIIVGGIPERSNGADCKSVGEAFGGSNPPPPTKKVLLRMNNIETIFCI